MEAQESNIGVVLEEPTSGKNGGNGSSKALSEIIRDSGMPGNLNPDPSSPRYAVPAVYTHLTTKGG